jgi:hypothetical protein
MRLGWLVGLLVLGCSGGAGSGGAQAADPTAATGGESSGGAVATGGESNSTGGVQPGTGGEQPTSGGTGSGGESTGGSGDAGGSGGSVATGGAGIQTTSVNANNAYALQRPWDDHMPLGAFTATIQARIMSWAPGSGISKFQNIIGANCLRGFVQIAAQLGSGDGAAGPDYIRAWEGEEAVTPAFYDVYTESAYGGWALFAIRNNGTGGLTELVFIPKGGEPVVVAMSGNYGPIRQLYLMGLVPAGEMANQIHFASAFLFAEYKDNAALIAQAASNGPIDTATLNAWYPLDAATDAHVDHSGNGYNANPNLIGVTASDSPY